MPSGVTDLVNYWRGLVEGSEVTHGELKTLESQLKYQQISFDGTKIYARSVEPGFFDEIKVETLPIFEIRGKVAQALNSGSTAGRLYQLTARYLLGLGFEIVCYENFPKTNGMAPLDFRNKLAESFGNELADLVMI